MNVKSISYNSGNVFHKIGNEQIQRKYNYLNKDNINTTQNHFITFGSKESFAQRVFEDTAASMEKYSISNVTYNIVDACVSEPNGIGSGLIGLFSMAADAVITAPITALACTVKNLLK